MVCDEIEKKKRENRDNFVSHSLQIAIDNCSRDINPPRFIITFKL